MRKRIDQAWARFDEVQGGSAGWECWYAICSGLAIANLLVGNILIALAIVMCLVMVWQKDVAQFELAKNLRNARSEPVKQ
ncbi:hypothetical protein [Rhodococcus erythropolis]|uniref:hypothetical protein n=1 Tax=Rhodococcus erythropolis TaxID=1833 RepID=UPI00366FB402